MRTKQISQEWGTVCTHVDTNTLPKQMVTYLNVNIVSQEVDHLADLGFTILFTS